MMLETYRYYYQPAGESKRWKYFGNGNRGIYRIGGYL